MGNKFEIKDGVGHIYVYTKQQELIADAIVDLSDFELVKMHKWYVGRGYLFTTYRNIQDGSRIWIQLHRFLLRPPKHLTVDHINRDKLDCRRKNMRIVSLQYNAQNKNPKGMPVLHGKPTSSTFRGVSYCKDKRKWRAQVKIHKKNYHVGYFDSEIVAAIAAKNFRQKHMKCNSN